MAARETFDFGAVDLVDGGFFHSDGDAQGTMMIGWGRRGRNKFVQLTQAEIGNFLAAAPGMFRTDDKDVQAALTQLAQALAGARKITLAEILDSQPLCGRLIELRAEGHPTDEAVVLINGELAEARKASAAKTARIRASA